MMIEYNMYMVWPSTFNCYMLSFLTLFPQTLDQILLDVLAGFLLPLEPVRHSTATRPRLVSHRIAILHRDRVRTASSRLGPICHCALGGCRSWLVKVLNLAL